ncbi:MAG: MFS transporter [Eubacteriaceae bacterium]
METKRIKLAIFSISSLLMISSTVSAILAEIQIHFPKVDEPVIQMVLTIPALVAVLFAFISGPISLKISKKNLVIFGSTCGLLGGGIAFIGGVKSIEILLFCSLLVGVAQGINSTMSMALISDHFKGKVGSEMMGVQSAYVNGGSVILFLASSFLAKIQWNYSYLVYLAFLPVLIITIVNLPNVPKEIPQPSEKPIIKDKLSGQVYFMAGIMFLFGIFIFVFQTNIALLVAEKSYGDASTSGIIITMMSVGGMITGILFGKIQKAFKKFTIPMALFITGVGMLLVFVVGSKEILFFSAVCFGFGMATMMPASTFLVANSVSNRLSATAIAIVTAAVSLGMFISPIVSSRFVEIMQGNIEMKFLMSGIGLWAMALLFSGLLVFNKDYHEKL